MADFLADLLQALVVVLPELLGRDFDAADFGKRRTAEAAENIVDAPQREYAREQEHDRSHHGAAEPGSGGVANTSKHRSGAKMNVGSVRRRIIGSAALRRNRRDLRVRRLFPACKASANASLSQGF